MSLQNWLNNGWLHPHQTSPQELADLLAVADRDFANAQIDGLSDDWKFGIAYNAVLKLCTMLLFDAGYRPVSNLAHYRAVLSIEFTLGPAFLPAAKYLDSCRRKRNTVEYEMVGCVSTTEVDELLSFTQKLRAEVLARLRPKYPDLGADS